MKKFLLLLCVITALLCFSGCDTKVAINVKADGTYKTSMSYAFTVDDYNDFATLANLASGAATGSDEAYPILNDAEELDAILSYVAPGEFNTTVVNGEKTFVYAEEDEGQYNTAGESADGEYISKSAFVITSTDSVEDQLYALDELAALGITEEALEDYAKSINMSFSVTFPNKITYTNGTLSADKKTVTFTSAKNGDDTSLYAYTKGSKELKKVKKDKKAPTVKGVKNGKNYKKAVTIKFSDNKSGVSYATLNGEKIANGTKVSKKGSYELVVVDIAGNTKTVKFTIKK